MTTWKIFLAPLLIMVAAVVTPSCSNRDHEEYVNGQGQAQRDLAKGVFKVAIADDSKMPAFYEYTELLRNRYQIGWYVSSEAWVRGYNEIASSRVEREIGVQVLKEVMTNAQKMHGAANAKP